MNVCLVSQDYPPDTARGGISIQTQNKARSLAALGHTVHVIACSTGGTAERREQDGIVLHRLPVPGEEAGREFPVYTDTAYRLGYSWQLLGAINRVLETTELDVIDFPEYGAEGLAYQLDRTPANWVPVVVQLHAPLALLAEHIGWPDKASAFYEVGSFAEGMSIKLADGLTACSSGIADFTSSFYGVARDSIDVVYSGVDADAYRPDEGGERNGGDPRVLYVGNVAPSKGVELVLEAVLRLRDRYPRIRLEIVGSGDGLVDRLKERVRSAQAEETVAFPGFVDASSLPALYRRADVFCSPSQYEGGVATTYCEAMASGCPIVASTAGGAAEAVVNEETGLLVPPLDVDAVVTALDRILGDPALRERMSVASRRRAEELFALDPWIGRILAAYERAIERSREKLARAEPR